MKTVFSLTYEHPVHRVFPYLSEPERWLEYVPALIERTKIGDGPVGPGTKWKSIDRVGPLSSLTAHNRLGVMNVPIRLVSRSFWPGLSGSGI